MRWVCFCALLVVLPVFAVGCGGGGGGSAPQGPISVSISPGMATVPAGQSQQFTAGVSGTSNTAVTWSSVGGAIDQTGLFTAPASMPNPPQVTVTATSQADPTKSSSATVTIVIGVQVEPPTATVQVNGQQYFFVNVNGATNRAVTWSVVGGDTNGTLSNAGPGDATYIAPATVPNPAQITVKATSQQDPTRFGTATVTLTQPIPSVTVTPNAQSTSVFTTLQFSANVANLSSNAVTWEVNGVKGGSQATGFISNGANPGLYVAPGGVPTTSSSQQSLPTTVTVTAVSQVNPSVSGSATVTIENFQAQNLTNYFGASGGNQKDSMTSGTSIFCCSGTLGALVARGGTQYILSNNHVLARDDLGTVTSGSAPGDNIIQPGLVDANCGRGIFDIVGNLSQFYNLESGAAPKIDAAIAQLASSSAMDSQGRILYLGGTTDGNNVPVPGAPNAGAGLPETSALVGRGVAKSGRTTGLTCSSVFSIATTMTITYPKGCNSTTTFSETFSNQIMVQGGAFSSPGDSGSLIVTQDTADPVALLFASSDKNAAGNPVGDILNYFQSGSNAMTFVGGGPHAVIGCTLPTAPASAVTAVPLRAAVSKEALQQALAVRTAHAAELMAHPEVQALGIGASQDHLGEPAILLFVTRGVVSTGIPQEVDGIRTRIIRGDLFAQRGILSPEQTTALEEAAPATSTIFPISDAEYLRAKIVHSAKADEWMSKSGVQGIGIGSSADAPGEAALVVFLVRGEAHDPIPATVNGVRTRVQESSPFIAGLGSEREKSGCMIQPSKQNMNDPPSVVRHSGVAKDD